MVLLVQVELAPPPLIVISNHSPSFIGYFIYLFIHSFIFVNQTGLISDCMSLVCPSRVCLVRKLGACEREALWAK